MLQRQLDKLLTSYPKPPHCALRAVAQLLLSPQTRRGDGSRIFGAGPQGSEGSGAGWWAVHQQWHGACTEHDPHHLPRGMRFAHVTGGQGLCSRRMRKWSWEKCSTAGAEILDYLWTCGESEIRWVALFLPFFKWLFFSGAVSEKHLCQAEYRREMIMPLLKCSHLT